MQVFDEYTEQENSLYEVVGWAMQGLIDTVNENRPDTFYGFLDDLYLDDRGSDISGEPGWALERIEFKEGLENRYGFISGDMRNALLSLFQNGEREAFWLQNTHANHGICLLSEASFWKVASDAFKEFTINNPGSEDDLKLAMRKYPQLSHGEKAG